MVTGSNYGATPIYTVCFSLSNSFCNGAGPSQTTTTVTAAGSGMIPTTPSVSCAPSTVVDGHEATCTANVTEADGSKPTGTVTFTSNDDDGTSSSAQAVMRVSASVSSDDSGDQGSGTATVTVTSSNGPVVDANGNAIIYFLFTDGFTGTISGNAVGEGVLVIHPHGADNVDATATFTGKIIERTGTATLHVSASGTSTSLTGTIGLNHGTGDLRGVEVEASSTVTATGPNTFSGPYNGDVQFDD